MKRPTYTHTAGLERYPQQERFAIYQATHKRLLSEDAAYHRRWQRYIAAVVCLAIIPIVGWVAAVVLAFRQQEFQNRRIGDVLRAVAYPSGGTETGDSASVPGRKSLAPSR